MMPPPRTFRELIETRGFTPDTWMLYVQHRICARDGG